MKKSILVLLSFIVVAASVGVVNAKTTSNGNLASAIRLYKSGNYVQSYTAFQNIVEKDPSNAVAYYYLAMTSAQMGKKDEAIENYARVIDLSTNRQLTTYARKGKKCLESPDACNEPDENETETDRFIRAKFGSGFSNEVRSDYEKKKIENLMREINRGADVPAVRFKDYKDFSSEVPTNDEIVAALRTLQRAGLSDIAGISNNRSDAQMLNLLMGNGSQNLNPQVIQTLLTNQLTTGF